MSQEQRSTISKTLDETSTTFNAQRKSQSEERPTHVVESTQIPSPENKLYDQTYSPAKESTIMPTTVNIYLTTTLYQTESDMLQSDEITASIPNSEKQFVISTSNYAVTDASMIEYIQKQSTISEIRPTHVSETDRVPTSIQEYLTTATYVFLQTNSAVVQSTIMPTSTKKYLTPDLLSSYHSQPVSSHEQFTTNSKSETLILSTILKESNIVSIQPFIQNSETATEASVEGMPEPLSTSYQSPPLSNEPFTTNSKSETLVLSTTIKQSNSVAMHSVIQASETTSNVAVQDMSKTLSGSYQFLKSKETSSDVRSAVLSATTTTTLEQLTPIYTSEISTTTEMLKVLNGTNDPTLPSTHVIFDAAQLTIVIDLNVEVDLAFVEDLTDPSSVQYISYVEEFTKQLTIAFGTIVDFSGIIIRNFSKGSVVCNIALKLQGNCNLGETEDDFTSSLNLLERGSIFGTQIHLNQDMMTDRFSAAAQKQATGDVCEIYVDITLCNHGYTCNSIPPGDKISCSLACKYLPANCLSNGGTCAFDNVRRIAFCRCPPEKGVTYSGEACEIRKEQNTEHLTTGHIIAITFGIFATLLAVPGFIGWVNKFCKSRQRMDVEQRGEQQGNLEFHDISRDPTPRYHKFEQTNNGYDNNGRLHYNHIFDRDDDLYQ